MSHLRPDDLAPSRYVISPVSGAQVSTCFQQTQEDQDPKMQNFSVFHFPIYMSATEAALGSTLGSALGAAWLLQRENTQTSGQVNKPLLSFDCIFLGLGRGELSFKLTTLFSGSSGTCPGPFL